MEKLLMCRICLAENVRMHIVADRNLHELYEKLTDIPFVTEDNRPILACFVCCTKLKQCYRFLRQCLKAEEMLAQMMNDDYEPNSLNNQNHSEVFSGFIKSPIVHLSIVDECQAESFTVEDALPAGREGLGDGIEPREREEHQSVELELENFDNSGLDVADIPPSHSESDVEDDVPLMKFKTEVKEEQAVSQKKRRATETNKNGITSLSLPLLGEAKTKDLVPKVGPRSILLRKLEIYKKTMHPDCHNLPAREDLDISISDLLHYPLENQAETSTPRTKSQSSNPPVTITIPAESQIDDLTLLLNSSLEGKGLLNLDKNSPLENAARQRLVRLIGTAILSGTPDKLIRTTVYSNWARQIVRVFPCEKPSVYIHSKTVQSTRGLITRLAGKLPDQIHNLKRKYRESGVIEKRRRISRSSDRSNPPSPSVRLPEGYLLEQEEEIPDAILWLKNSSEPWSTVLQKWTETTRTRLNHSKELPISQYFKEYPALRKSTGYILLEKDFEELYAGMYTDIYENFPPLKENLFKLAKKRNSAHNKDTTLNELLSLQDSSEESSNIACMLLIPTLLTVTSVRLKNSQKKVWRPSKAEVREGFITHVKNDCDVRSVINARREKFWQFGLTVQPFIVIVGPSLDTITSYFVVIDEVCYDLPNILSAVSACLKLIWVVNAQYSAECLSTWMFIQHAYFKLKTKFDSQSTSAHTLLGELGIDI